MKWFLFVCVLLFAQLLACDADHRDHRDHRDRHRHGHRYHQQKLSMDLTNDMIGKLHMKVNNVLQLE